MAEHSILIVEDDRTVRELLKHRLGKHYDVATAPNGQDALDQVETHAPDLIISDIMMPKMDGFALQSALQSDKNTRVIPFIFLTARADEPARKQGQRSGVDDYITKPFDMDQLLSRVERLLERVEVFQSNLDAEIGRDFSNRLLPDRLPEVEGYRFDFHAEARAQGGGDLFDWVETDHGTYFLTIGDVMGKGLRAKFYAYSFLSYVRGTLHTLLQDSASPAAVMTRINEMLLNDEVLEDTFASFLLLHWDPANHTITCANAGHCRPILAHPEGSEIVEHSDLILGLEEDTSFSNVELSLAPGHALVAYTDGLTEQPGSGNEMLGEAGVRELAAEARNKDAPIDAILDGALRRSSAQDFQDDILVVWIQRADDETGSMS
ncbi:MAG: PP2C family protein-serine/threonine phosphatase [Salinivenus sp.]